MDKRLISKTPTLTTVAYTANDVVGTKMVLGPVNAPAKLMSLTVIDRAAQAAVLEVLFFEKTPTASTLTDNGAPTLNAAEVGNIVARVPVAAADYAAAVNGVRVANLSGLNRIVKGSSLTAVLVTTGTPTYAVGSLTLKFGIEP